MKSIEKNNTRTRTTPIKITLTEAEILEDLHYPVPVERIQTVSVSTDRNRLR